MTKTENISDSDEIEEVETRKKTKKEQRMEIREGHSVSPVKAGGSRESVVNEIRQLRSEIRSSISKKDDNGKIQFRVADREKVLLNIDKLTDILVDILDRDTVVNISAKLDELTREIKQQRSNMDTVDKLKDEMAEVKKQLRQFREDFNKDHEDRRRDDNRSSVRAQQVVKDSSNTRTGRGERQKNWTKRVPSG